MRLKSRTWVSTRKAALRVEPNRNPTAVMIPNICLTTQNPARLPRKVAASQAMQVANTRLKIRTSNLIRSTVPTFRIFFAPETRTLQTISGAKTGVNNQVRGFHAMFLRKSRILLSSSASWLTNTFPRSAAFPPAANIAFASIAFETGSITSPLASVIVSPTPLLSRRRSGTEIAQAIFRADRPSGAKPPAGRGLLERH